MTVDAMNDDLGTLTMAVWNSWPEEKQKGLAVAVRAALSEGKPLSDLVTFEGENYVLGYALGFIDR